MLDIYIQIAGTNLGTETMYGHAALARSPQLDIRTHDVGLAAGRNAPFAILHVYGHKFGRLIYYSV